LSMEDMSSMTQTNAEYANQADELVKDANKVVVRANEAMEHLILSMEDSPSRTTKKCCCNEN
jgi:methyl-accepting chemotaxis protein